MFHVSCMLCVHGHEAEGLRKHAPEPSMCVTELPCVRLVSIFAHCSYDYQPKQYDVDADGRVQLSQFIHISMAISSDDNQLSTQIEFTALQQSKRCALLHEPLVPVLGHAICRCLPLWLQTKFGCAASTPSCWFLLYHLRSRPFLMSHSTHNTPPRCTHCVGHVL